MIKISLCTALIITLITFVIIHHQAAFSIETKRYGDSSIGVKLSYPSDWGDPVIATMKGESCSILEELRCLIDWFIIVDSNPLESWEIIISAGSTKNPDFSKWCSCRNLPEYMRHIYELAKFNAESRDKNFSFINDNQTSVGMKNYSGWQMEISESSGNELQKQLFVFVEINGTFYQIRFITEGSSDFYSKELPRVKELINSIEFLTIQKVVTKVPSFMNTSTVRSE